MSKFFTTGIILGLGVASSLVYTHYDIIKAEFMKQKGVMKAEKLTINFFYDLLKENENISLDEAILKFENKDKEFDNLKDFAESKQRTVESYRKAYHHLFIRARIRHSLFFVP